MGKCKKQNFYYIFQYNFCTTDKYSSVFKLPNDIYIFEKYLKLIFLCIFECHISNNAYIQFLSYRVINL